MSLLEIKKIQAEIAAVVAARLDQEYRFEQMKDSMDRLEKNIQIQIQKETELELKLKELKGEL